MGDCEAGTLVPLNWVLAKWKLANWPSKLDTEIAACLAPARLLIRPLIMSLNMSLIRLPVRPLIRPPDRLAQDRVARDDLVQDSLVRDSLARGWAAGCPGVRAIRPEGGREQGRQGAAEDAAVPAVACPASALRRLPSGTWGLERQSRACGPEAQARTKALAMPSWQCWHDYGLRGWACRAWRGGHAMALERSRGLLAGLLAGWRLFGVKGASGAGALVPCASRSFPVFAQSFAARAGLAGSRRGMQKAASLSGGSSAGGAWDGASGARVGTGIRDWHLRLAFGEACEGVWCAEGGRLGAGPEKMTGRVVWVRCRQDAWEHAWKDVWKDV